MTSTLKLYGRAVGSMLRRTPIDADIPDVTERRSGVAIDPDHLAAYAHVCGFTVTNTLPPTYPQVLAFPLTMSVMTGAAFPLPAVGLVHIAEEISVYRAPTVDDTLDIAVHPENLRPHHRGRQFDMVTTVRVDGAQIWHGRSTYLGRENTAGESSQAKTGYDDAPATTLNARWRLPGDLGRRYGSVSGDRNPIHLHPLTARPFGFSRPIAHGMWTLAATLATVQNRLAHSYRVHARFARPVRLPSTVQLATGTTADMPAGAGADAETGQRHHLVLTDTRDRTHLTVDIEPVAKGPA